MCLILYLKLFKIPAHSAQITENNKDGVGRGIEPHEVASDGF